MNDVIIVGAGCAGLTAGLYAARAGLSALIIERMYPGGQITRTHMVENYPGFPEGIQGIDLAMMFKDHAERAGAVIEAAEVTGFDIEGTEKKIVTTNSILKAKTVVLAMGASYRELGIASEQKFIGSGVSYCATCDGAFFRGKDVVVVGGGDTAVEDALYLASLARRVYVVHRRDELRAQKALQKAAMQNKLIEFVWDSEVTDIIGENAVNGINVRNKKTLEERIIEVSGVFIAVGTQPHTKEVAEMLETDETGYIVTDNHMHTSIPGVFAAGDIVSKPMRQVITAAADGAVAIYGAQSYIRENG